MRFSGKTAIVTGGGTGIGQAVARHLARDGAAVVIGGRSEAGAAAAQEIERAGGAALFVPTDVAREGDCKALVDAALDRFGRLDLAFNNAGGHRDFKALHDTPIEEADWVFDVNLKGVFYCLKYQARAMLAGGGGAIVNNSSIFGLKAMPGLAHYVAAKHGVVGLTRAAALDYANRNVRVNAVCPGAIKTPSYDRVTGGDDHAYDDAIPMRHIGAPDNIAEAVLWLLSDAAAFVTGASLSVDGGMSAM